MAATAEAPTNVRPETEWPYRFEVLPLDELTVDPGYQRPLTTFVNEVRDDWKPHLVGTIFVSERRNGDHVIVDGQTRWSAAREREDVTNLPALVYHDLTPAEEAKLMADLAKKRRQIRTYDQFRAELFAGDAEAKDIARLAKRHAGLDLRQERTFSKAPPITALQQAYRKGVLREVLEVVSNAWSPDCDGALGNQTLRGLTYFLTTQERVDLARLTDRLGRVDPLTIPTRARALQQAREARGQFVPFVSEVILSEYTRRSR